MVYALDTNIIIRYLRDDSNVRQNFNAKVLEGHDLIIPKIVDYEMRRGFLVMFAPKKETAYKILTERCEVVEMSSYSWGRAEQTYASLYHKGFTIGELDILIAATCLENNFTLVTNNTKHFQNIEGLLMVDWS